MQVTPKEQYTGLVRILDWFNPILVVLATIGIFFDYSPYKQLAAIPNDIIAVLFAVDFLLRLLAFPAGKYFVKGWGWIDFLASLPGFLVFFSRTPLLALLRIVRIGRFFRIIRILRFLRAFSFLKNMRADSVWVQDRVMKIGVSIVLVFMVGIVILDVSARNGLEALTAQQLLSEFGEESRPHQLLTNPRVLFASQDGIIQNRDRSGSDQLALALDWTSLRDTLGTYVMEIPIEPARISPDGVITLPNNGVLVSAYETIRLHEIIMTIAIGTLLVILLVIMFYMGAVFARDVRTLQLVVDSYDAEDYLLLKEEANARGYVEEDLIIDPNEDEMENLLKVAVVASDKLDSMGGLGIDSYADTGLGSILFGGDSGSTLDGGISSSSEDTLTSLHYKLEDLETNLLSSLNDHNETLIKETIQKVTPALVKYIKQQMKS
jgi:hypothetical protein